MGVLSSHTQEPGQLFLRHGCGRFSTWITSLVPCILYLLLAIILHIAFESVAC